MTQAKETVKTPYDGKLEELEAIMQRRSGDNKALSSAIERYESKREGYLAHGSEKACGSKDCACYQEGIVEVRENPTLYDLASPSRGSTV